MKYLYRTMTLSESNAHGFDFDAFPCAIYLPDNSDNPLAFVRSEANAIEIVDALNSIKESTK